MYIYIIYYNHNIKNNSYDSNNDMYMYKLYLYVEIFPGIPVFSVVAPTSFTSLYCSTLVMFSTT